MTLTVTVPGVPVGQGRLSALGRGRVVHSNASQLLPWREAICWHTRQAMTAAGVGEPMTGPLQLAVTFTLPRPASAPKSRWAPDKRPDLDHLIRALCDGITASGAWVDDAQVVAVHAHKHYQWPGLLPGATFTIQPAEESQS